MSATKIQWTERSWNPVRGCSRVSPGCQHCYAERMAARNLPGMKSPTTGESFAIINGNGPHWTGKVELIPNMLDVPLKRRKPTLWFVNSMSDLFHEDLPDADIDRVRHVMVSCPQHTFQILTKRPARMLEYMRFHERWRSLSDEGYVREGGTLPQPGPSFPTPNIWLGVSVEDQQRADERIPLLLQTPAAIRFLSVEPLLGPVDLESFPLKTLDAGENPGIDWVIVGGESGPGARPMHIEWPRSIVAQCKAAGVPVFVKQMGTNCVDRLGKINGAMFDRKGGNLEEWPKDLRMREMPNATR